MSIYINGKKLAGNGENGKSPYQIAVQEGYIGSESTFNNTLKNIGDIEENVSLLHEDVNSKVNEINNVLNNYATLDYVNNAVNGIITDVFYIGTTSPSNTKLLWIDTNASTGGLKYHNGTSWIHVPVAWK